MVWIGNNGAVIRCGCGGGETAERTSVASQWHGKTHCPNRKSKRTVGKACGCAMRRGAARHHHQQKGKTMPSIDLGTLRRVAAMQRRYADSLARQAAEQRLSELDRYVESERERRGMQPIVSDTGKVIAWVHTRQQPKEGR